MGGHKRFRGWHHGRHGGHGRRADYGWVPDAAPSENLPLGRPKPILWVIMFVGLVIWSIFAWLAYGLVEPLLGWVSTTNASAGSGFYGASIAGLIGQLFNLLGVVSKPAIIAIWAIGGIGLALAPLLLPKILRLRRRFHH